MPDEGESRLQVKLGQNSGDGGKGEIQDMLWGWKQHRPDVRDKGESGVMDTLLSCRCKQLGGVVPVPEAGGTGGEADLGAC